MSEKNPNVDFYFSKAKKRKNTHPNEHSFAEEIEKLRTIILDCQLTEELKWGCPCYTHPSGPSSPEKKRVGGQRSNVVLIHAFKEYCALLFFKGALLNDEHGILIQQTENVQVSRQIRFTNIREIVKMERILKAYIYEAIEVEKAGLQLKLKTTKEFIIPEEFQVKLTKMQSLKTAFYALTPGRQRGYILYFSAAKQSKTREARVQKYLKQILNGKGLDD